LRSTATKLLPYLEAKREFDRLYWAALVQQQTRLQVDVNAVCEAACISRSAVYAALKVSGKRSLRLMDGTKMPGYQLLRLCHEHTVPTASMVSVAKAAKLDRKDVYRRMKLAGVPLPNRTIRQGSYGPKIFRGLGTLARHNLQQVARDKGQREAHKQAIALRNRLIRTAKKKSKVVA
jgi:DNA-binding phage protein